jgi:hypothetical protein
MSGRQQQQKAFRKVIRQYARPLTSAVAIWLGIAAVARTLTSKIVAADADSTAFRTLRPRGLTADIDGLDEVSVSVISSSLADVRMIRRNNRKRGKTKYPFYVPSLPFVCTKHNLLLHFRKWLGEVFYREYTTRPRIHSWLLRLSSRRMWSYCSVNLCMLGKL